MRLWLILGDLNELLETPEGEQAIVLLCSFSIDPTERVPEPERWSHYEPGLERYSRPDLHFFAAPALAKELPDARRHPSRQGLSREIRRYQGPR